MLDPLGIDLRIRRRDAERDEKLNDKIVALACSNRKLFARVS